MDYLDKRKHEYEDRIVGDVGGNFRYDRDRLVESVGRSAERVVKAYNVSAEAEKMAVHARTAVAETAMAEVGAIGLGALVTVLATTVAADVTGILAASAVAALGLFVIPARRQSAKKGLVDKVAALRTQLVTALTTQFQKELDQGLQRINEAVAPYTRFVRAERDKLQETQSELAEAQHIQGRLRAELENLL
jgi:hypothetical protein